MGGRESKRGNGSGKGEVLEQKQPVLDKGGRRTGTCGMEAAEDGLQEKMEICHCRCRQKGWDMCMPTLQEASGW